ncbi:hypothetical protein BGW38_004622 [Lunasporangiospora selenospora]|uniref:Galactose oxidase n=1 Tax=Lunasporangiospora selenospora TaxID=979761 RepID=A0A9P6KC17_9FUNG|nr:hypothetical protein BGW38_004622 [Lunasporangiospora selenospora]
MTTDPGTPSRLVIVGGESSVVSARPSVLLSATTNGNQSATASVIVAAWTAVSPAANSSTTPLHRLYHASYATAKDGIVLHGGYKSSVADGIVVSSVDTLQLSKTPSSEWQTLLPLSILSNAPNAPALARHTLTLTPGGQAIILGGINSQKVLANLSTAYVLDTQASSPRWEAVPLKGQAPEPRMAFSTVMVNSTTMLLYGGTTDFKSSNWVTFYLDIPTWTWTSPSPIGLQPPPRRWGHTATMSGNIMIVAFGASSQQKPDSVNILLLDTSTNTWITQYTPPGSSNKGNNGSNSTNENNMDGNDGKSSSSNKGNLSLGAVLGIALVITAFIVIGAFYLFVKRKKKRTRNTIAREEHANMTARSALQSRRLREQATFEERGPVVGTFGKLMSVVLGRKSSTTSSSRDQENSGGYDHEKRHSETLAYVHPASVVARMEQRGVPPNSIGYPEEVVEHGCGDVPVSKYAYPNQPCAESTPTRDGNRAQVIFHAHTEGQKEAARIERQQRQQRHHNE